jgi:hypothetical protein
MDKKLDRPGNWDAEMAALHEKTAAKCYSNPPTNGEGPLTCPV